MAEVASRPLLDSQQLIFTPHVRKVRFLGGYRAENAANKPSGERRQQRRWFLSQKHLWRFQKQCSPSSDR